MLPLTEMKKNRMALLRNIQMIPFSASDIILASACSPTAPEHSASVGQNKSGPPSFGRTKPRLPRNGPFGHFSNSIFVVIMALSVLAKTGVAQKTAVQIQAPQFIYNQQTQVLSGQGPVTAKREDLTLQGTSFAIDQKKHEIWVSKNIVMTHQKLEITADSAGAVNRFETLVVKGKVKVHYEGISAQADQGEYFIKRKQVLLSGNPSAWQGQDRLSGKQILIDLKTQKLQSLGHGRVQISPETLAK